MNLIVKKFLDIGLAIAETQIPAIATVELAVKNIGAGEDKKDAVLEMVKLIPEVAELLRHEDIVDKELFERGIDKLNDGYVDIMNSIQSNSLEKIGDKK